MGTIQEYASLAVFLPVEFDGVLEPCVILGRQGGKMFADTLLPPGGKVEPNDESLVTAAEREFVEETGFDFKDLQRDREYSESSKIYSVVHSTAIFHLFGAVYSAPWTIEEFEQYVSANAPRRGLEKPELTEVLPVRILDLLGNPKTRSSVNPEFIKEISAGQTELNFHTYLRRMMETQR